MDATEAVIEQYLKSVGFTDVVHEPDGKVPPDFLVDGSIAVWDAPRSRYQRRC